MAIDLDDEILQDFLVEAGEILELLNEQLVDLEQAPGDTDLLNAVFRGFHTVKGGAGFLSIEPMVDACHVCEDVFNVLRQGDRTVTPALMDAVLQGLDVVQTMFADIKSGREPIPASPELLAQLKNYSGPESDDESETGAAEAPAAAATESGAPADEADSEFDALLDAMDDSASGAAGASTAQQDSGGDEITDDEFEALLDEMHGKGKHGGKPAERAAGETAEAPSAAPDSDLITDDEFDQILDGMYGKGRGPTGASDGTSTPPSGEDTDAGHSDDHGGDDGDALITDDEFDQLLDNLHGQGKGPSSAASGTAGPSPAPAPKPAAKPPPAPASAKPAAKPAEKPAARPPVETSVRVDTERLDEIMNLVGELVLVRNRLQTLRLSMNEGQVTHAITNLDMVTSDLQASVMKTRMQPIKKVFGRFPRVVRDLSRQINKEIKLEMMGEDTDLDKNLVEALADPLVHLVRNAVDHGIETPEEREKKGKSREGTVSLSAQQEGDHILLTIEDDGAGMDPEKLRAKAVEKGLMDEDTAARLEDREAFNLIFMAGFSTKDQISDISGRGVGMDVVKTRITQLNGTLEIDSELGKGSILTIKVPLTLAILPTLMIGLGQRTFALPLSSVNEIFELQKRKTNVVDGQLMVMVRDKAVPLFYLSRWLLMPGEEPRFGEGQGQVIIVTIGSRLAGLVTDQVVGQEEVVIKPLGAMLQGLPGFAGSTITGDGSIALILDVQSLLKARARKGF